MEEGFLLRQRGRGEQLDVQCQKNAGNRLYLVFCMITLFLLHTHYCAKRTSRRSGPSRASNARITPTTPPTTASANA